MNRKSLKKIILFSFLLTVSFGRASYGQNQSCKSIFSFAQNSPALSNEQIELQRYFEITFEKNGNWNSEMAKELDALKIDPNGGEEKIKILRKLGFQINNKGIKAPRYIDFVNNYLKQLAELGIPQSESILPAVVLWRVNERQLEYRFVTPGIDPWPSEPGFQMTTPPYFNLPYEVILKAHQNGKFPLINSGVHDIFHFVSFLRNPEFTKTLRLGANKITNPRPVKYMGFRLNFLDEWLSLGNPNLKERIRTELSLFKKFPEDDGRSFKSFLDSVNSMPEETLIAYAYRLEKVYPTLLQEYGGAVTRSAEKDDFSGLSGGIHFFDIFLNPQPMRDLGRVWRESPSLFPKTLNEILEVIKLPKRDFAKYLTDEIVGVYRPKFSQLYRANQKLDSYDIPEGQFLEPSEDARTIVIQMLRTHIARMEYVLWRSVNDMPVKDIVKGMLKPDGSVDQKVLEFVRDGWGENSFLYKVLSYGLEVK